jgi:triacylglycerol lipase
VLPTTAPRRRLLVVVVVLVALVLVAGLVHAVGRRPPRPLASGARPGAVLLVPGYGGDTGGLRTLAAALRAGGRHVEIVAVPRKAQQAFEEQVTALDAAVTAVERLGEGPVDIVAHSNGGVLARYWARHDDGAHRARRIVTLGSPHHGTALAARAAAEAPGLCPAACQEVRPDSPFLRALNAGDETPAGTDWVSVFTDDDEVVTPTATSNLVGAVDIRVQAVCADAHPNHGGLLSDPAAVGVVLDELDSASVHPEPASACARVRRLASS